MRPVKNKFKGALLYLTKEMPIPVKTFFVANNILDERENFKIMQKSVTPDSFQTLSGRISELKLWRVYDY